MRIRTSEELFDKLGYTPDFDIDWIDWPDFSKSDVVPIPLNGLAGEPTAEYRIDALGNLVQLDFQDTPLLDVVYALREDHGVYTELGLRELAEAGIDEETPVTFKAEEVPLREALRSMLDPLGLTYVIHSDTVGITTKVAAEGVFGPSIIAHWSDPYIPELRYRIRMGGKLVFITSFADDPGIDSRAVGYTVPKGAKVLFVTDFIANLVDIAFAALMVVLASIAIFFPRWKRKRRRVTLL